MLLFLFLRILLFMEGVTMNSMLETRTTNKISFQYYNGLNVFDFTRIKLVNGLNIMNQPNYDNTKNTVFYLPGYSEKPSDHVPGDSIDLIAIEFLKRKDVNFIVVNYQDLMKHNLINIGKLPSIMQNLNRDGGYVTAVKNVPKIGNALGAFFRNYIRNCACQNRVHLIGFSLGAHIAHFIAKALAWDGVKLQRITGLEPAAPLYENNKLEQHLTENDALLVDIVHTNAGSFGWSQPTGHIDFWPNKGVSPQPYCAARGDTQSKCDHYCSVYYFVESINNNNFLAQQCTNAVSWTSNQCRSTPTANFGYNIKYTLQGNYFFSTNANYPFAKGQAGLVPN